MNKLFLPSFSLLMLLQACAHVTSQSKKPVQILDASQEDALADTGTSSGDIKTIADRMSKEIIGIDWSQQGAKPRIAVLPIYNQTRFRLDPKVIQNKLTKELVVASRGKVLFLARDSEEEVIKERQKKRAGIYDQGKVASQMAGADYLLKGEMRALSKATREGVSDYIVYSFSLIEAETGALLWMGDYETKKVGDVGAIYQ